MFKLFLKLINRFKYLLSQIINIITSSIAKLKFLRNKTNVGFTNWVSFYLASTVAVLKVYGVYFLNEHFKHLENVINFSDHLRYIVLYFLSSPLKFDT